MVTSQNKVALVTGSGRRRVGNVVAESLGADGYRIAIHYNSSAEAAEETVARLQSRGVECIAVKANVSDENEVNSMIDEVHAKFGRLDVLVTTASIWSSRRLENVTAEDVRKNFEVNTLGTFLCCRRAGLMMVDQPEGGVIVTIGDWAISRPYRDHAAYFVSKGAMPTLTRVLAVELGTRNPRVRVNCIHPGPVMFPPDMSDEERQAVKEATLVKDADSPDTIAKAVKFLIDNQFVTGVCLPVDGGRTIYAPE